jgi:hypothetical protein
MKRAAVERYRQSHREEINARRRARYARDGEFRERENQRMRDVRAATAKPSRPKKPKPTKAIESALPPEKSMKEIIAELRAKHWNADGTKKKQK